MVTHSGKHFASMPAGAASLLIIPDSVISASEQPGFALERWANTGEGAGQTLHISSIPRHVDLACHSMWWCWLAWLVTLLRADKDTIAAVKYQ
jgi:hypothetical protein